MGSIQNSVLSMMGSVGSLQQTANENKKKALRIAAAAATGGAAALPGAIAKEAGVNISTGSNNTSNQASEESSIAQPQAMPSMQQLASDTAMKHSQDEIDIKRKQYEKLKQSFERGDFKNVSPNIQGNIKKRLDEVEKNGIN